MSLDRPVVVDASVAVKWVIEEELSERAHALYAAMARAQLPIVAPPHFACEVLNALYQRTRRKEQRYRISEAEAEEVAAEFLDLAVELRNPANLYLTAFAFARAHRQPSIYDALYVVLAQMVGTELWTADRVLLQRIGAAAPWVRWIGDYRLPVS